MKPIDPLFEKFERAMDVMSRRQQLLASNVGNLDTPGYKTVDVNFNEALRGAVEEAGSSDGSPAHRGAADLPSFDPREVEGLAFRPDGNNVSLDREMAEMAATRHRYEVAAMVVRSRLRQIRAAILDGRSG